MPARVARWRSGRRRIADRLAAGLASWVVSASDDRLRRLMSGPLRRLLLWAIFRTMAARAQPDASVAAVVEFGIGGARDGGSDRYRITFADGRCRASREGEERARLTLELEQVAFLRLVAGSASPERLLLAGKLRLRGDLFFALTLASALRLPQRAPARAAAGR